MILMSSFSVVDAKKGEVVGTKAMKILILQVVFAFWSKIGSK
jgi:hypothetical protein